jgi:hypothetical protein
MADSKSKRGKWDREQIALSEAYEVNYFARKHGRPASRLKRSSSRRSAVVSEPMRLLREQHKAGQLKLTIRVLNDRIQWQSGVVNSGPPVVPGCRGTGIRPGVCTPEDTVRLAI